MVGLDDRGGRPRELEVPVEDRDRDRLAGGRREAVEHRRVARRVERERGALAGPMPPGVEHRVVEVKAVEAGDGRDLVLPARACARIRIRIRIRIRASASARSAAGVQRLPERLREGRLAGRGWPRDAEDEPSLAPPRIRRNRGENPLDRRLDPGGQGACHRRRTRPGQGRG